MVEISDELFEVVIDALEMHRYVVDAEGEQDNNYEVIEVLHRLETLKTKERKKMDVKISDDDLRRLRQIHATVLSYGQQISQAHVIASDILVKAGELMAEAQGILARTEKQH